jgi:hypothetical protein
MSRSYGMLTEGLRILSPLAMDLVTNSTLTYSPSKLAVSFTRPALRLYASSGPEAYLSSPAAMIRPRALSIQQEATRGTICFLLDFRVSISHAWQKRYLVRVSRLEIGLRDPGADTVEFIYMRQRRAQHGQCPRLYTHGVAHAVGPGGRCPTHNNVYTLFLRRFSAARVWMMEMDIARHSSVSPIILPPMAGVRD